MATAVPSAPRVGSVAEAVGAGGKATRGHSLGHVPRDLTAVTAALFDATASPLRATLLNAALYALCVYLGRALLVGDGVPGGGIAATWPSVGVGMVWFFPYILRGRWWRRADAWGVVAALTLLCLAVNALTDLDWPPLLLASGVCNSLSIVVAGMVYGPALEGERAGLGLTSGQDMRRLALACAAGIAAAWFTFPLVGLLGGRMTFVSTLFWAIRNGVNLFYGAIGAVILFGRTRVWHLEGAGRTPVTLACVATMALLVLDVTFSETPALGYLVVIAAIGVAAFFSVAETWVYLLVVGVFVTVMSVQGASPFGGTDVDERAGLVHLALLTVLLVAMSTAADRESRAYFLEEMRRGRAAADEQAARYGQQAQFLQAVVSSMADGVFVLDSRDNVTVHNEAADSIIGTPVAGTSGDLSAVFDAARASVVAGPSDARVVLADGTTRVLAVQGAELVAGDLAVVVRDVTDERRQVDELRTFARVAAHDLRQPMASIELWSDLLADELGAANAAQIEAVDAVRAGVARMDSFLTDLTNYTVARDGALTPEPVGVAELTREVVAARRDSGLLREDAEITVSAPHVVVADRALLRQLLDNLVGNALKYVEPGEAPRVAVATRADGAWIVLDVDDAGPGIPAAERVAVFDEFYRAPTHRAAYPGTGLGLAICRRIADRHGGLIAAGQSPLGGARIELRLPA